MKNSKNATSKLTNNTLSDTSHFILYNTSNYKAVINNSVSEILSKFVEVIIEYMRFISEKIIMKNKPYYRFIFERGIETLIHVFSVIFYFTKNLELTFYHTQKAYYFYIEFIEQISDDNVTFLQLSSRDAILFVYKKTIFDLNNEYKKNIQEPTSEEKTILATVDTYTHIYKSIVLFIINHTDFKYENKNEYINTSCNAIEFISETLNKNKIKSNHIECVYLFITLLDDKKLDMLDFFRLLDEFIKKVISKKKFDEKVIKNKIYDSELGNFIINNELNKIVEWIFTD
jgi:hypothetical protein